MKKLIPASYGSFEKPIPSSLIKNAAPHDVREVKAWSSMQRTYGGGRCMPQFASRDFLMSDP
jgi:hypothetical protein